MDFAEHIYRYRGDFPDDAGPNRNQLCHVCRLRRSHESHGKPLSRYFGLVYCHKRHSAPSFIIVLALVKFYVKFHGNTIFESVMSWIRPSVVGLIGAAAIILMFNASWAGMPMFSRLDMSIVSENFPDWKSWALFGAAMVASMFFKVGPIPIIVAGGVLGFLIY